MPCKCAERKAAMLKWLQDNKHQMLADLLQRVPSPQPRPKPDPSTLYPPKPSDGQ